jgi:organic hydroperoxide reductase OsmC/OhrA
MQSQQPTMLELEAHYRRLPGTRAAMGQAGGPAVVADRPEGRAGGGGAGFNGGQLLGLSLGACYCNDLEYTAEEMGLAIDDLDVRVLIALAGSRRLRVRSKCRSV